MFSSRFKKLATKEGSGEVSVDREGRNLFFKRKFWGKTNLYLGAFSLNSLTLIKSSYLSIGKGKLDPAVVEHLAVAVLHVLERRHHVGPHLRGQRMLEFQIGPRQFDHRRLEGDFPFLTSSTQKFERPQNWRPSCLVRGPGVNFSRLETTSIMMVI